MEETPDHAPNCSCLSFLIPHSSFIISELSVGCKIHAASAERGHKSMLVSHPAVAAAIGPPDRRRSGVRTEESPESLLTFDLCSLAPPTELPPVRRRLRRVRI